MKPDPSNVFMNLSRHDLGRQAIVILEKLCKPGLRKEEDAFLHQQADRLIEAFHHKISSNAQN